MKQIKMELVSFLFLIVIILFCIVFVPFIQIWAINTLFKTTIEYSWLNWFCILLLNSSITANRNIK